MERLTFLLLLFFLHCEAPAFAREFWNIDCGGKETFVNANNLTFEGDAPYIRTGISREAQGAARNGIPREVSTLREFPAAPWKKSCYTVPVEQGTKVLVRTQHYYGNYDGLNSPPEFTVRFDNALWCDVTMDLASSWRYCEVVYLTTKKQGTDICFVRTQSDKSPIVSTIEIRRLPLTMYGALDFSGYAIFLLQRFAFGANQTIGYPDDAYNRNWDPNDLKGDDGGVHKPVIVKRESATPMDTTRGVDDSPPELLFEAAAVAPMVRNNSAANLTIRTPWMLSDLIDIYFTMYFTEPVADNGASANKKRMFHVCKDGELLTNASDPIQPSYGAVSEFLGYFYLGSNETTFDLVPANGSTLPPAISGMETFYIYSTDNATYSNDAAALSLLQTSFTVLQNWTGDPCLPTDYNWEWVGCKYPTDAPPRINQLLLNGYQLSGHIPDFSGLDALEVIDFSNNSFTGSVPEFLATLPNLQTLDLSDNDFDSIPESLRNGKITLITKGNPKLNVTIASPPGPSSAETIKGCNKFSSRMLVLFILFLATAATT